MKKTEYVNATTRTCEPFGPSHIVSGKKPKDKTKERKHTDFKRSRTGKQWDQPEVWCGANTDALNWQPKSTPSTTVCPKCLEALNKSK